MALPKSVTKVSKDGNVTYTQSVDRVNYTLRELTRAALRDVGKYVCKQFRSAFYAAFKKQTNRVGKAAQYWVKHKQKDIELQVGIKPGGWYGGYQETGTSKMPRYALLTHAVQDNIATIVDIESQYLSALENEAHALALINNNEDDEGGGDE